MTDKTNLIREIHEYVTAHGGENTATHLLVQAASAIQTQAAELEAVGAGGVQALSAAPAAFLKSVIALCSNRGYSPANIEAWDKNDKWIADLWRQAEAMLAASPTPPAEQPAITSESGAVYAELPEEHWLSTNTTIVWNEDSMRDFADRTHALRMQAAPKAAPGEPVNGWPVEATIYKRRDEWVLELSGTINDCAFTCRHTQPGYLQPEDVAGLPSLYSEGIAPQQEAQEPVAWLNPWRADQVTTDYDAYGERGIPLYTAPRPAPTPLSDDAKRLDWLDRNIFSREMSDWDAKYGHGPDYNMWVVFSPKGVQGSARNIIDAALAAQGDTP